MATAPTYCTHRQLKDVFPQVDSFDSKRPIYGWRIGIADWYDTSLDIFYSANVGLITNLFIDGAKVDKIDFNTTETTKLNGAITPSSTTITVDSGTSFGANDIIKIGNEYMRVVSVSSNDLTINAHATNRGLFGSASQHHVDDSSVYIIIDASADVAGAASADPDSLSFVYDTDLDLCILIGNDLANNDPNDNLVEGGEDFSTLITRITANASRYLDSRLDPNLPKNQLKDREGNYDYIIIRTTALIASSFLIRSHDPNSDIANKFMEEVDINIELLNTGKAALSWQNTGDSSKGFIRDVGTVSGAIRPVDTRGRWAGAFDIIKIKIIDSGAFGTCTYSVWTSGNDKLGINEGTQIVTAQKINGQYQPLAGGLEIRFGSSEHDSTASAGDTWECVVSGYNEEVDLNNSGSKKMTRGGIGIYGRNNY
jgi:hypothetical protein